MPAHPHAEASAAAAASFKSASVRRSAYVGFSVDSKPQLHDRSPTKHGLAMFRIDNIPPKFQMADDNGKGLYRQNGSFRRELNSTGSQIGRIQGERRELKGCDDPRTKGNQRDSAAFRD
jgi:hypothetical protein